MVTVRFEEAVQLHQKSVEALCASTLLAKDVIEAVGWVFVVAVERLEFVIDAEKNVNVTVVTFKNSAYNGSCFTHLFAIQDPMSAGLIQVWLKNVIIEPLIKPL